MFGTFYYVSPLFAGLFSLELPQACLIGQGSRALYVAVSITPTPRGHNGSFLGSFAKENFALRKRARNQSFCREKECIGLQNLLTTIKGAKNESVYGTQFDRLHMTLMMTSSLVVLAKLRYMMHTYADCFSFLVINSGT